MKLNELKAEIARNGMTIEQFADATGIKRTTLWRRFKATEEFTLQEIRIISKVLNLSNKRVCEIFFNQNVS